MNSPTNALRRHAERRRQRVPTVTMFTGPVGTALALWRRHNEAVGRQTILVRRAEELETAWLAGFEFQRDLMPIIAGYLASKSGRDARTVHHSLRDSSRPEVEAFVNSVLPDEPAPSVAWLCRTLLPNSADLSADLTMEEVGDRLRLTPHLLFVAVSQLVPVERIPACLLIVGSTEMLANTGEPGSRSQSHSDAAIPAEFIRGANTLVKMATDSPLVPLALHLDRGLMQSYFARVGNQREGALLREGVIALPDMALADVQRHVSAEDMVASGLEASGLDSAARVLIRQGGSEESLQRFAEVIRATAVSHEPGREAVAADQDRARSAAERYLYDRLQHHPRLAGYFVLNQRLELATGPIGSPNVSRSSWEVDLVSCETRVAIEIDGYYHFLDPESYRRDRRKDFALQWAGYTVLRFLAEDVVRDLEQILERIEWAVERGLGTRCQ